MFSLLDPVRSEVNSLFSNYDAFSLIAGTLLTIISIYMLRSILEGINRHGFQGYIYYSILQVLKSAPGGSSLISKETEKLKVDIGRNIVAMSENSKHSFYKLPEDSVSREMIREELILQLHKEQDMAQNRAHGGLYVPNTHYDMFLNEKNYKEMIPFLTKLSVKDEAYLYFSHSNTLYPFQYPGTRKFETEIISMVGNMLHSKGDVAGNVTSGGTESIFMAVKCWRSFGKEKKQIDLIHNGRIPNMIVCTSVHPAFHKAASYLNIETRIVGVNKKNGKMDLNQIKKSIDKNTILIVASAPNFPTSVIDDIPAIANIAKRHDIPVHVDHCLGGFVLSYLLDLGVIDDKFDFSVDGVCSISCDLHKQLGSVKGASSILYANQEYQKYAFYSYVNWPGGLYASPCFRGSCNGGIVAATWACMVSKGKKKLEQSAKRLYDAATKLVEEINQMEDLRVLVNQPIACAVPIVAKNDKEIDIYCLGECMREVGGWNVGMLQYPKGLHFQMGHRQVNEIDQFVKDLKTSLKLVKQDPKKYFKGNAAIYGGAASMPDRSVVEQSCAAYVEMMSTPLIQVEKFLQKHG